MRGGLIAGVAAWFAGRSRVVALEPEGAATLHRAREAGTPVDVPVSGIAADSLGARRIGGIDAGKYAQSNGYIGYAACHRSAGIKRQREGNDAAAAE